MKSECGDVFRSSNCDRGLHNVTEHRHIAVLDCGVQEKLFHCAIRGIALVVQQASLLYRGGIIVLDHAANDHHCGSQGLSRQNGGGNHAVCVVPFSSEKLPGSPEYSLTT